MLFAWSVTTRCPWCGGRLTQRRNREDDKLFIGCEKWRMGGNGCNFSSNYNATDPMAPYVTQNEELKVTIETMKREAKKLEDSRASVLRINLALKGDLDELEQLKKRLEAENQDLKSWMEVKKVEARAKDKRIEEVQQFYTTVLSESEALSAENKKLYSRITFLEENQAQPEAQPEAKKCGRRPGQTAYSQEFKDQVVAGFAQRGVTRREYLQEVEAVTGVKLALSTLYLWTKGVESAHEVDDDMVIEMVAEPAGEDELL